MKYLPDSKYFRTPADGIGQFRCLARKHPDTPQGYVLRLQTGEIKEYTLDQLTPWPADEPLLRDF